jgi:hypothetical protein
MTQHSKAHRFKLFPPFGRTADAGHAFVYLGVARWEGDVFAFLDQYMKP